MKKLGLAIVAIAAATVLVPARSDAKKHRDMTSSTMNVKMPKAAKVLKIKKGTLRVRNGLVVNGKSMRIKANRRIAPFRDSGLLNRQLDMGNPQRPKVKYEKNRLLFPVK